MKLDRNTNQDGHGKYALVNMRKLMPIIGDDAAFDPEGVSKETVDIYNAFHLLVRKGIITLGNPGDQFFVMKYKDKFTADALHAYAEAVRKESMFNLVKSESDSLMEYANEIFTEAQAAAKLGNRIPD